MNARIPEDQKHDVTAALNGEKSQELIHEFAGENKELEEVTTEIAKLLSLSDDNFEILAPGILQNYLQQMNSPELRLSLIQKMQAEDLTVEEIAQPFQDMLQSIQEMEVSDVKKDFLTTMVGSILTQISETEGIAKRVIEVPVELCHENAKLPSYAHVTDSGADVFALEDITIGPGEKVLVPTGLKVGLPPGYELQVRPKSGRALKTQLRIANTPGTIDQGYRDEIKVIVENIEPKIKDLTINDDGEVTSILYGSAYTIGKGEKFCQLVLQQVPKANWTEVGTVFQVEGEDRGGGFGSTGLK